MPAGTPADNSGAARRGMSAAEEHAHELWKAKVRDCIRWVAENRRSFCTDDIWEAMERYHPDLVTHENRAMGPLIKGACNEGICSLLSCEHCGTRKVVKPARRDTSHGTDVAWYQSLVYIGA
jgi:hypothetical protein